MFDNLSDIGELRKLFSATLEHCMGDTSLLKINLLWDIYYDNRVWQINGWWGLLSDSGWTQPDVRSRKGGRGFVHLSSCPLMKLSSVSSSKTVQPFSSSMTYRKKVTYVTTVLVLNCLAKVLWTSQTKNCILPLSVPCSSCPTFLFNKNANILLLRTPLSGRGSMNSLPGPVCP